MLFVKALKEGLYRAVDCTPLAAAVLFISSRVKGFPRLLHEIEEASSVPIRVINRWQREICDTFKLLLPPFRFFTLIPRIAQKLRMTTIQIEQCRQTCLNIEQSNLLESMTPQAVAAAAILLTCNVSESFSHPLRRLDTKAIAAVSYTTSKAIQNAINIISPYADQLSTHLRVRSTSASSSVTATASASASASNGVLATSIESMALNNNSSSSGECNKTNKKNYTSGTVGILAEDNIGSNIDSSSRGSIIHTRPRSSSLCSNSSTNSTAVYTKRNKVDGST